jgi:hypothetical protein
LPAADAKPFLRLHQPEGGANASATSSGGERRGTRRQTNFAIVFTHHFTTIPPPEKSPAAAGLALRSAPRRSRKRRRERRRFELAENSHSRKSKGRSLEKNRKISRDLERVFDRSGRVFVRALTHRRGCERDVQSSNSARRVSGGGGATSEQGAFLQSHTLQRLRHNNQAKTCGSAAAPFLRKIRVANAPAMHFRL